MRTTPLPPETMPASTPCRHARTCACTSRAPQAGEHVVCRRACAVHAHDATCPTRWCARVHVHTQRWCARGRVMQPRDPLTRCLKERYAHGLRLPHKVLCDFQYSVFSNCSSTVTVSPSGPPGLFKGVTTAMSGVLARFPWLLPVRNSFASYGASAVTRTRDRGHVAEVKKPISSGFGVCPLVRSVRSVKTLNTVPAWFG